MLPIASTTISTSNGKLHNSMDIVINLKHSGNENIRNILAKGIYAPCLFTNGMYREKRLGIDASYSRPFGTNEDGINAQKMKSSSGYGNLGCHAWRRILYS